MISADLGKKLESVVAELVDSGRYGSKSEVLREGVRLVQERELRLAALDISLKKGLGDADDGNVTSAETVFSRLEAKYSSDKPSVKAR